MSRRSLNMLLLILLASLPCPSSCASSFLISTTASKSTKTESFTERTLRPSSPSPSRGLPRRGGNACPIRQPARSSWPFPNPVRSTVIRGASDRRHPSLVVVAASSSSSSSSDESEPELDEEYLRAELTRYLEVRERERSKSVTDDEESDETKKTKKRVAGGSRGNKILEYVSVVPDTIVLDDDGQANPFDYDQLTKYGFQNVVRMLMKPGVGRRVAYDVMGMTPPPMPDRLRPKPVPELVIDREGYTDPARYKGLKMSQATSDDAIGEALESIRRAKAEDDEPSVKKPKLVEEEYVQPFADRRNVSPRPATPEWTPEMLDEEGRKRGRAIAWARKSQRGEMRRDPYEDTILVDDVAARAYCSFAALLVAFAYGRATPLALSTFLGVGRYGDGDNSIQLLLEVLQIPALVVVLAAIGSGVVCGTILAPRRGRNPLVWTVKGFAGGPITVNQLRGLDVLRRNDDDDDEEEEGRR